MSLLSHLARLLLGGFVDVLVGHGGGPAFLGQDLGDGLGQGGLAVVDVAYGANVDVGLVPFEGLGAEVRVKGGGGPE